MRHEFSDQQLTDAYKAALKEGSCGDTPADYMRAVVNHLPEPAADDWQECTIDEIRKGDRVKVVDTHEAGDQTVYEGEVVQVSKGLVMTAHHQLHSVYNSKWYRIPAPVQHPDPAEHPVIYVKECDLVGFIPKIMVWHRDSYVGGHQCLFPEHITDWSPIDPAKVVEDDR